VKGLKPGVYIISSQGVKPLQLMVIQ